MRPAQASAGALCAEALAALAKDDMRHLNGVAPEVREPALKIVEQLQRKSATQA